MTEETTSNDIPAAPAPEAPIEPAPAPAPVEAAPEAPVEPAPAPAPVEAAPEAPADTGLPPVDAPAVSDEEAHAAAAEAAASQPESVPAAPGETLPQARKPKHPYYRDLANGEVSTALRTPAGYEDDHPELYEGVSALPKE
jgi:hypothetical protein